MQIQPRLIRLRDAPSYLGIDKNTFNRVVRPALSEVSLGQQTILFDRLEIDAWAEDYIQRNGRRPLSSILEDDLCQSATKCRGSASKTGSGRTEAEQKLIRRLAEIEEEAKQQIAIYTFEAAGLRYLEDIAHSLSAETIAIHLGTDECPSPVNWVEPGKGGKCRKTVGNWSEG